ncbi:MAG: class II aldolase/adducin family protein [Ilumatobacteraceae bacterium]
MLAQQVKEVTSKVVEFDAPMYPSPEAERLARKQHLAAAYRALSLFGMDEGVAGHVSVRDPILTDHFWLNPYGVYFGHIRASDLLLVSPSGEVVQGEGRLHRPAFSIHSGVLAARPDLQSAAHVHSIAGKAVAAGTRRVLPLTQDATAFFERHEIWEYEGALLDPDEGKRMAYKLADGIALILANHGLLTVGTTIDAAIWRIIAMERSCVVQLLAEAAGPVVLIKDDLARKTGCLVGSEKEGWLNFQPLLQRLVREQPDLLD